MKMEHETITSVAGKVTYAGAGGAIFFGLTANEFAAVGGLCIGVISLVINVVFKYLAHKELQAHHRRVETIGE
jgi:ABC-type proline/glycine betaine transport system permease subunit